MGSYLLSSAGPGGDFLLSTLAQVLSEGLSPATRSDSPFCFSGGVSPQTWGTFFSQARRPWSYTLVHLPVLPGWCSGNPDRIGCPRGRPARALWGGWPLWPHPAALPLLPHQPAARPSLRLSSSALTFRCRLWEPVLPRGLILRHRIQAPASWSLFLQDARPCFVPQIDSTELHCFLLMVPVSELPALNFCRAGASALSYAPRTQGHTRETQLPGCTEGPILTPSPRVPLRNIRKPPIPSHIDI